MTIATLLSVFDTQLLLLVWLIDAQSCATDSLFSSGADTLACRLIACFEPV